MSLYRPKGSKYWWMDFIYYGQRVRKSTKATSKTVARDIQKKYTAKLAYAANGVRPDEKPRLLSYAAAEWQQEKELKWSPKMRLIVKNALAHLLPELGKKLLIDIEGRDVVSYQRFRLAEGASNRTINIEVGVLRGVMKQFETWERVRKHVNMLPERQDVGHALTAEEESALLLECGRSRSRCLLPFVVVAIATGARYNTVRTLQWRNIDFANGCLRFGKDKTAAGSYRKIPLNHRAIETLKFWAENFPNRIGEHYVFPFEKVGAAGDSFERKHYDTDPTKPIGDIKEAWEAARRRTRRHCPNCRDGILIDKPKGGHVCASCEFELDKLPAGLTGVRFHDLRHSFVSRAVSARVPLPIIAKIVGWSAGTMAKMAARYGHFAMEDLRSAVESVSTVQQGSPRFSPQSEVASERRRTN